MQWIQDITDFIFLSDAPAPADILFIPGNGHAELPEYAAQLYLRGLVPYVLPSGRYSIRKNAFSGQVSGNRIYSGNFETEWAFMRHILMANGVPDSAILREDQATYTYDSRFTPDGPERTMNWPTRRRISSSVRPLMQRLPVKTG